MSKTQNDHKHRRTGFGPSIVDLQFAPCHSFVYYESPRDQAELGLVLYLINTTLPRSRIIGHVLALELPQLSM